MAWSSLWLVMQCCKLLIYASVALMDSSCFELVRKKCGDIVKDIQKLRVHAGYSLDPVLDILANASALFTMDMDGRRGSRNMGSWTSPSLSLYEN